MQLPDFLKAELLNGLREKLNAELIEIGCQEIWTPIDSDDLIKKLNSNEGILVNITDITFDNDGTFEYKGHKVLVYIRDQRNNPNYGEGEYRFHLCNCSTIEYYVRNNRLDRYVATKNLSGKFKINILNTLTNKTKADVKELKVCKNCLVALKYKGYTDHKRDFHIFQNFSIKEFFEKYESKFKQKPKYTDETAPINNYPTDAKDLHIRIKELNNWKCQQCGIDLKNNHKYLNIHHVNGLKNDDRIENLLCLCIRCHANKPDHINLKWSYDFHEFNEKFPLNDLPF